LANRADGVVNDSSQKARGISHLVSHDPELDGITQHRPLQSPSDSAAELLLRGLVARDRAIGRNLRQQLVVGMTPCLLVEILLAAEVVIDGSNVRPGFATDQRDGRAAVALLRK
jgi:hypothetical protein